MIAHEWNITERLQQAVDCQIAGNHDIAEETYRQVLVLDQFNADAHHLLGCLLLDTRRIEEAISSISKAISLSSQGIFYCNLGNCYLLKFEHAVAEVCFRHAIEIDPDCANAWSNLGFLLIRTRRLREACVLLEQANARFPSHEGILCNLGLACKEIGRYYEALAFYKQAAISNASSELMLLGMAECLSSLNQNEEALSTIDRLISLRSSHVEHALRVGGNILSSLGRIDEARAYFDAGLLVAPANIDLLYSRVALQQMTKRAPIFRQLRQLEPKAGQMYGIDRTKLYFALGKAFEDVGDFSRAAKRYAAGASYHLSLSGNDDREDSERSTAIVSNITAKLLDSLSIDASTSDRPIFILGMPRSGTTLVEQILASHPAVFGAGEVPFATDVLQGMTLPGDLRISFPDARSLPPQATLRQRADAYLSKIDALPGSSEKRFFTDKMPDNYHNLGLLAAMFPNARFIHCRRDPVDTCISCYTTLFGIGQYWSFDFNLLGNAYRRYWDLMQHWRKILPGRFLEVHYEQLIEHPEQSARALLQWCGLEWDERVLRHYENDRPIHTASSIQVRQPIYRSSVGRWKKWERHIRPLMSKIGDLQEQYWAELDAQMQSRGNLQPSLSGHPKSVRKRYFDRALGLRELLKQS